ncbi:CDP-alcohol phosphatidyltransferase family protein [Parvularcula dongshanensis]|uniref:Phosphatidylglycerophosphate synthase n=1 Tax=Parvularcula dongshanensis TaxID=1173995 RepID=A0A840I2R3_9PROT|nr:CDP-alcohol phosphatidyltransferase family protein [Parvularcula dongshanensis]MBB4659296.1 phosphatidylglycerophosphate synthase [Parvularcula dongshanensis]
MTPDTVANAAVASSDPAEQPLRVVGSLPVRLYGLDLDEWQARAWSKAGVGNAQGRILVDAAWILSPALMRALVRRPGTALVERTATGQRRLAAAHLPAGEAEAPIAAMMQADLDEGALEALGLAPYDAEGLAGRYDHQLRKREAPYALDLLSTAPSDVEWRLFQSAYKGVTDFVTKYAWPRPAFAVTRWAAGAGLTPNMVTTASLVLTILAFFFFMQGQWVLGFLSGWGMTFLDTVDGKLARTTMTSSKWGNRFDHGLDLIHPPFWYWAWYQGTVQSGAFPGVAPEWLELSLWIILVGYCADRVVEGIFIRRHGFHIHVWRPADSLLRSFSARRNPNMFVFMVAVILAAPAVGIAVVAAWTAICLVFHAVRLFEAEGGEQTSWLEAA